MIAETQAIVMRINRGNSEVPNEQWKWCECREKQPTKKDDLDKRRWEPSVFWSIICIRRAYGNRISRAAALPRPRLFSHETFASVLALQRWSAASFSLCALLQFQPWRNERSVQSRNQEETRELAFPGSFGFPPPLSLWSLPFTRLFMSFQPAITFCVHSAHPPRSDLSPYKKPSQYPTSASENRAFHTAFRPSQHTSFCSRPHFFVVSCTNSGGR